LVAKHDLALVLFEGGRFSEAEDLERRASVELRATLGDTSPIYWIMLSLLGRIRASRGDVVESEKLCRQALSFFERVPAFHGSAERGRALYHLCRVLDFAGRSAEAEPVCEEARDILVRAVGARHPYSALAFVQLGGLAHDRGQDDRAEELIRQGLNVQRDRLPAGHYEFASTDTALGPVLAARGKAAEAESLLREALALRRRTFPAGDWRTAQTASILGEVLAREGKRAEAAPLLREGYEAMRVALGEKHAQTLLASRRLEAGVSARALAAP
jgi:tetratricopeptide (TPR) repeat protein